MEVYRSVQPPVETRVMPTAVSWLLAWASVSLVTACAGPASPATATSDATRATRVLREVCMHDSFVVTRPPMASSLRLPEPIGRAGVKGPYGLAGIGSG